MKKLLTIALAAFALLAGCENDNWNSPSTTEGAKVKEYHTITMDIVGAVERYTAAWEELEAANLTGRGENRLTVAQAQEIWKEFCDAGDGFVEALDNLIAFERDIPQWKTRLYHGGEATYNALYYGAPATRWNPKHPWIANVMDDYVGPVIEDISSFVLGEADEDAAVTATRETVYQVGKFVDDNLSVGDNGVSPGLVKDVGAMIGDTRTQVADLEATYQQEAKTDEVAATENLYTGYRNLQGEKMKEVAKFGVGAIAGTVAGGLAGAALAAAAAPAALIIAGGAATGAAVGWFVKWYTGDTRADSGINYLMAGRTELGGELPLQYIPEGSTLTLAVDGYAPIVFEDFQHPGAGQDGIMALSRIPISEVGKEGVVPYLAYYRYKRGSLGGGGGGTIIGKWWCYSVNDKILEEGVRQWEFIDEYTMRYPLLPQVGIVDYTYNSQTGVLSMYNDIDVALLAMGGWTLNKRTYRVEKLTATEMVFVETTPNISKDRYVLKKY